MRSLTLLLIFYSLVSTGQTSVYHPFPDSSALWNIHFSLYCFSNGTGNENYSITISGDTTISAHTYHKLTTPFIQSLSTGICSGPVSGYKGSFRQDTLAHKVFYIPRDSSSEQVLYDFNLHTGDTVKGYLEARAYPKDIVNTIDSVLVGTQYRKRWSINSAYHIQWIEGVGSTYGLLEQSPGLVTDGADYAITCFSEKNFSLYPNTASNCELITAVDVEKPIPASIRIFPNPSNGLFSVLNENTIPSRIELWNMLGEKIFSAWLPFHTSFLDLSLQPKGIYFYCVIQGNKVIGSAKLIVE